MGVEVGRRTRVSLGLAFGGLAWLRREISRRQSGEEDTDPARPPQDQYSPVSLRSYPKPATDALHPLAIRECLTYNIRQPIRTFG